MYQFQPSIKQCFHYVSFWCIPSLSIPSVSEIQVLFGVPTGCSSPKTAPGNFPMHPLNIAIITGSNVRAGCTLKMCAQGAPLISDTALK